MLCYRTEVRTCALALLAIVCLTSERSEAKDRWTNDTGKHQVEAEFVEIQGEIVVLRNESGKKITVPLAKLDEASRRLAQTRAEELSKQKDNPAPTTTILTLEQLNERARGSIRPEDNMVVAFWSAIGIKAIHPDEAIRRKYLDALGGNVVEPAVPFVSWQAFVKAEGDGQNFGDKNSPLRATDHDAVDRWLTQNQAPLDAAVAAVSRSAYYSPTILEADDHPLWKAIIPAAIPAKDIVYGLLARTSSKLRHDDLDGAVKDVIAAMRLARHLNHESTLMVLAVARAIENVAVQTIAEIAHDDQFTRETANQFTQMITDLPPRVEFLEKLDCELAMGADVITRIAAGGPKELIEFIVGFVGMTSPDAVEWADTLSGRIGRAMMPTQWDDASRPIWISAALELQPIYRSYGRDLAAESIASRHLRFGELFEAHPRSNLEPLFNRKERSPESLGKAKQLFQGTLPADVTASDVALQIHSVICTDLANFARLDADAEFREAMIPVILASALYRVEHSAYPFELSDLKPDYLPEEVVDPLFEPLWNRKPIYQYEADGYSLYSAGCNAKDDHGVFDEQQSKDDLGLIVTPQVR